MVRIRLKRFGAKKRPYYRIVAIDQRRARDGRALEYLGTYNPVPNPSEISLKADRIEHWVSQGAQMTNQVKTLLKRAKEGAPAAAPAAPVAEAPAPSEA